MEITEIGLLAVKLEGDYGVDAAPGVNNVIPTVADSLTFEFQSTPEDRKLLDGTHDRIVGYNTLPHVTLKFRYELRSNGTIMSGSPADAVEIDALLQAANLSPTYAPEPEPGGGFGFVTYAPAIFTDSGPSVTCYWWSGSKLHKLIGGKVDFKLISEVGKMHIIEFTVMGKHFFVSDAALPTGVVFNGEKPPLFQGANFFINGFGGVISKFEFDLGNRIKLRKSAYSIDGIAGFVITSFNPKGRVDPEAEAASVHPIWTDWKASSLVNFLIGVGPGDDGKSVLIEFTNAEWKSVNYAAREEVRIHQAEFNLVQGGLLSFRFY